MALSTTNRSASSPVESFEEAAARLRSEFVRWAARVVGPAEAEDAVQEVWIAAWRRGLHPISWDAWLRTILVNELKDRLRARQRLERRAGGSIESLEEREML